MTNSTKSTASPVRRGRPAGDGKQRLDTRQSLVRYGVELLTEQGFGSTGIDQILRHLNVPKGSFYHYFSSKEAFGLAVIDSYADYFQQKLDRWLTDTRLTPLTRPDRFMEDARRSMIRYDFKRGCLIGNLSQEFGRSHLIFSERLEQIFNDWQQRLKVCLDQAVEGEELSNGVNTEQLASFFWIGWEGAVMRARLTRSDKPLLLFANTYFHLLKK